MTAYYVNVAEWTPEQVGDWMRGLDDNLLPYIHNIVECGINGHRLLSATVEDLQCFQIEKLGHQEIFMSAVDLLREFHFNLDRENLQYLAMQLGCKARSLYNELRHTLQLSNGKPEQVTTSTLAAVADIIDGVKDLVSWLDRAPFDGHEPYLEVKRNMLKLCLELATNAQRDLFAEHPVQVIREGCLKLVKISDGIVCEFLDPLVLQPASLDVATIKKKTEEDITSHPSSNYYDGIDLWIQGMLIQTSYKGVHMIGGVKFQSPAHQCGKIEEGDEVVQVNYQTVVGWQQKKLKAAMLENSTKVILTLKKRPRHSNNFGQIYVKPYRLPSKKRESYHFRWHLTCDSKPEPALSTKQIDTALTAPVPSVEIAPPTETQIVNTELPSELDSENDTDDDSFLPDNHQDSADAAAGLATATGSLDVGSAAAPSPASVRLILPKNRLSIQRRATVTGASPTSSRAPLSVEQFWKELWKEGIRCKGSENSGAIVRLTAESEKSDLRPHSSMAHYEATPQQTVLTRLTKHLNESSVTVTRNIALREAIEGRVDGGLIKPPSGATSALAMQTDTVHSSCLSAIRSHHSRLDKSQSTPAYESVIATESSHERKPKESFFQKQNRVEEENETQTEQKPHHDSTSEAHSKNMPSPPALPPRNKTRQTLEEEELGNETRLDSLQFPQASIKSDDSSYFNDGEMNCKADPSSSEQPYMGLRPHEIRDLMLRGLWPRHLTDEDKSLPALTRVTRLDSNFDPVPGSTVPRIAPSLLVSYGPMARHEEEVHVTLPPIKASHYAKKPYNAIASKPGIASEIVRHRRVPCRDLGEGDCQGWLFRRRQTKGFFSGPRWTRRYFVLKKHTFYGYRDPEDQKAESFIYLPGFSSSRATEVKSKKFAFKIFNTNTVFYFACETKEELSKWFNAVQMSAIATHSTTSDSCNTSKENSGSSKGAFYSETEDESFDESDSQKSALYTSLGRRKDQSLAELTEIRLSNVTAGTTSASDAKNKSTATLTRDKNGNSTVKPLRSPVSASLDRKYLRFLRVAPEKQPIPTPQFRSYRRPSPASSPTALVHPEPSLSPSFWQDDLKPPPRPPSESKPTSPLLLQPPPAAREKSSTPQRPVPVIPERHTIVRNDRHTSPLSEQKGGVRKSVSASRLHGSSKNLRPTSNPSSSSLALSKKCDTASGSTAEESVIRRHSVEISEAKRKLSKSPAKSQTDEVLLARSPDGQLMSDRRLFYGSLNRGMKTIVGTSEIYESARSGYAKIKPRKLSNVADYSRASRDIVSTVSQEPYGHTDSPTKSASFFSSPSKSPCSPIFPSGRAKEAADQSNDPSSKGNFHGSPDQFWINSLRSSTSPHAKFQKPSPLCDKNKNSGSNLRLKSTACYQPMNFPLSPKDDSKMKAAFEMNLDVPQCDASTSDGRSPINISDAKQFFKMLVSPKLGRKSPSPGASKLHPKPLHDVNNGHKSPKTLLGSPRLHRAFFGHQKDRQKPGKLDESKLPPSSFVPEYARLHTDAQSDESSNRNSVLDPEGYNDSLVRSPASVSLSSQNSSMAVCSNDSCPETPKTPSIKPAMGIAMIGKQRRTPLSADSPFSSPPPSASLLRQTVQPNYFTYSLPAKEPSPSSGSVAHSIDGLEYPPVFEPGTYCLSSKNTDHTSASVQASLNNTLSPPIPAPRTKFLSIPVSSSAASSNTLPEYLESNSS